jgi:hypothetical protein
MTMKTAELRQKDVAGLEAEVKSLQRLTSTCACRRPRSS